MLHRPNTNQFDLFLNLHDAKTVRRPHWQTLPAEARQALTRLMVRLIVDHVDGRGGTPEREETRHDV